MASSLVLVANAADGSLSTFRLNGGHLERMTVTPGLTGCSTFAVDGGRGFVYASVKPDADHPDRPWILERVRAVDPGPKKTDRRLKDFLFMELKALIGDEATYRAVKAEVKAPAYRREFGTSVTDDRASAARWATSRGSAP